jgi:hypothetical protein
MKRLFLGAALAAAIMVPAAAAQQQPQGGTSSGLTSDDIQKFVQLQHMFPPPAPEPVAIGGPVGSPTFVTPQKQGGVINIGQAFGEVAEPYINAAVNALILAGVSWLGLYLKKRFNVTIDQGHRDALVTALQNQAGSLIADGLVTIEGGKVTVPATAVTAAAAEVLQVIPDAAAHLGLTPDYVARRIVDTIPQTAAGAAMIAQAPAAPKAA